MNRSLQLNLPPTELNAVPIASPTARKSLGDWRAIVGKSLGRAGVSQKAAAADLGVTEPALSKQLAGHEHLSFWRMAGLSRDFWQELVLLVIEFYDLPIGNLSEVDKRDLLYGRELREAFERRMAR